MAHERYFEAVDYLQQRLWHELPIVPVERALQHRMEQLLMHFGEPHVDKLVIHVAGTAGKGSTAAMVAAMLRAAGWRTGLYTKPHLQTFIERIDVDGQLIAPEEFADIVLGLDPLVRKMHLDVLDGIGYGRPALVEVTFAACMQHFARADVDVAVIEAGLGGRTDYTNVFRHKVATIITNVAYDHRERLGWTLPAIAREKAALIYGETVITGAKGAALRVIDERCLDKWSTLQRLGREVQATTTSADARGSTCTFTTGDLSLADVRLPLAGAHQVDNAAMALAAVSTFVHVTGLPVSEQQMREGLESVRISGRLEQMQERPIVLLDSAHNPVEAQRLAQTLREHWLRDGVQLHLVAGILADKDQAAMVRALASVADRVFLTQPPLGERIGDPEPMLAMFEREIGGAFVRFEPSPERALDLALAGAGPHDVVCVTGSMFLVGALRGRWVPEQRILDERTALPPAAFSKG